MDRWLYFDYNLWIPSDGISKMTYIEYDMQFLMGLSTLHICGDWLKKWDVIKALAKLVKISEKELSMISFIHQY